MVARALSVAILHTLGACGRLNFDRVDPPGADAGIDAVTDALAPCAGPFGAPTRLVSISSLFTDEGASLSEDGLEIYVGSNRPGGAGGADLYVATRATKADPFSTPQRIVELASASDQVATSSGATGTGCAIASARSWRQCHATSVTPGCAVSAAWSCTSSSRVGSPRSAPVHARVSSRV